MKRIAVASSALVFAVAAIAASPEAEARRGGFGWGGGLVAAAVIGGLAVAALSRNRYRSYGYSNYGYYRPSYAYSSVYYAPRRHWGHRRHW